MKSQSDKIPLRARWPAGLAAMLAATLLLGGTAWGNNLVIENFELTGFNDTEHYVLVQFDLRWENSWRLDTGPGNYDAAWVWVKFRAADGVWRHATLNLAGHSVGTCNVPAVLDMPDDATGTFIYRTTNGMGDLDCTSVQLRWNYGEDSLTDTDGNIDVSVFGVEMVYIPEGPFHLGSGGTENGHFFTYPDDTSTYLVTSEGAIDVGETDGYLFYEVHTAYGDGIGPIPATFPKGYAPFYLMKYELTSSQHADFLNHIPPDHAVAIGSQNPAYNCGIVDDGGEPPVYSASIPDRACGFMQQDRAFAYIDWAGLRLPTELEWVKAARGNRPPVPNEYAWGGTGVHTEPYTLVNEGAPDERVLNPGDNTGNAAYGSLVSQHVRVGIFAASFPHAGHPDPPSRAESGASFYGLMEMSGNVYEWVWSAGKAYGRSFAGEHGDGTLKGDASWYSGNQLLSRGVAQRGGMLGYTGYMRVSWRGGSAHSIPLSYHGLRAARTAP